jgi:putative membrane protein
MKIFVKILLYSTSIYLTCLILPGITVDSFWVAIWAALAMGIINFLVKPLLTLFTLPLTLLTFGLFLLVINALMLQLGSALVPGFYVAGFWWAFLGAIIISVVNDILNKFVSA